jgi:E3 ubiquitin-protein ligase RHF
VGADDAELEERIIQHLAAAAAMGRTHRIARRDGSRGRSSGAHGRPQFLVYSTPPSGGSAGSVQSYSSSPRGENETISVAVSADPSSPFITGDESSINETTPQGIARHAADVTASPAMNSAGSINTPGVQNNRYLTLFDPFIACELANLYFILSCLGHGGKIGCSGGPNCVDNPS